MDSTYITGIVNTGTQTSNKSGSHSTYITSVTDSTYITSILIKSSSWLPFENIKNSGLKMVNLVLKTAPNHQNSDQKSDQNRPSPNFC